MTRRRKLLWKLIPPYIAVSMLALAIPFVITIHHVNNFYIDNLRTDLFYRSELVKDYFIEYLLEEDSENSDLICKELGNTAKTRITIITSSGKVLGDTDHDPGLMDNHRERPEIIEAISSGKGSSIRFSKTVKKNMFYAAIPVFADKKLIGFIRTAIPVQSVNFIMRSLYLRIGIGSALIIILGSYICMKGYMRISVPLGMLQKKAEKYSDGFFESSDLLTDVEEISELANALNLMASRLDSRMKIITEQKNVLEAVLSSMVEGVIAMDWNRAIVKMNRAAGEMLGIDPDSIQGKQFESVIKNQDLAFIVNEIYSKNRMVEKNVALECGESLFLNVHGVKMDDRRSDTLGALMVFNDITRIRQLEVMRKDFIANVTHELKTPITSMKGSVENLTGGAINNSEDTLMFLGIIKKQCDRMNAIINDLLTLSRLDANYGETRISMEMTNLGKLLCSAKDIVKEAFPSLEVKIDLFCDENIFLKVNGQLLEQAVVNLLDNAVKYSGKTKHIAITVKKGNNITITVKDHGMGISESHLSRIFERFYRVDKGRNRKMGGTGLGLAIVKNITQVHNGYVEVSSIKGEGSAFKIVLPVIGPAKPAAD